MAAGPATENIIQSAGNLASVRGWDAIRISHPLVLVLFTNRAFSVKFQVQNPMGDRYHRDIYGL
jgi:hypothetical protein